MNEHVHQREIDKRRANAFMGGRLKSLPILRHALSIPGTILGFVPRRFGLRRIASFLLLGLGPFVATYGAKTYWNHGVFFRQEGILAHFGWSLLCFAALFAAAIGGGGRGARKSGRVGLQHLGEYLVLGYLFGTLGSTGSIMLYTLHWTRFIAVAVAASVIVGVLSYKFMASLPRPQGRFV